MFDLKQTIPPFFDCEMQQNRNESLIIVRLTPTERGAVAAFLLYGKNALPIFLQYWKGKTPNEHPTWGRLQLNESGDCEEAVVHYPFEQAIEIHVHGGDQIASAIETLFKRAGAVSKTWRELFAAGTSQQELSLRQLPFAPTERTAQILLDQYNGAYDREITAIEKLPASEQEYRRTRLAELTSLGKHLVEPFRVVLAGASNAGKSSLLNAILGFQRSIVYHSPGTTRDIVSAQTALDGFPVTFFDTAGFRQLHDNCNDNDLERQGMDRSLQSLSDADLVVWVIDSSVPDSQRPACPVEKNVLQCWNKKDLLTETDRELHKESAFVSALTGEGVETLLHTIIRRLIPILPQPGEAVPL